MKVVNSQGSPSGGRESNTELNRIHIFERYGHHIKVFETFFRGCPDKRQRLVPQRLGTKF